MNLRICILISFLYLNLKLVESFGEYLTGRVGKNVRNKMETGDFHYLNSDMDATDVVKPTKFSLLPDSSTTDSKRPSLFNKLRSSFFKSNPSTPRNSGSSVFDRKSSLISDLRSRISRPATSPKGSSLAEEDGSIPRSASQDIPSYFDMFLDLRNVSEIELETLPVVQMSSAVEEMVTKVSEKLGHYTGSDYLTNLNRILAFVNRKYELTPFVVYLAGKMLNQMGRKAPNALNLFIEKKMPFLAKSSESSENKNTILSLVQVLDLRKLNHTLAEIKGCTECLLKSLEAHLHAGFLDVLYQSTGIDFDELMMFYMIAFNNCPTSDRYASRIVIIFKILMSCTADSLEMNRLVSLRDVEDTLNYEFGKFSQKLYKYFGIED